MHDLGPPSTHPKNKKKAVALLIENSYCGA